VQLKYQMLFQTWGVVAGCLLAAGLGIWLERRRARRETGNGKRET